MIETIAWVANHVRIIDQRLLPRAIKHETIETVQQMWRAIRQLRVRGAPAIGVAAAFGVYLGVRKWRGTKSARFYKHLCSVCDYLASARPTAVNLFWALEQTKNCAQSLLDKPVATIKESLLQLALELLEDDMNRCRQIGKHGARLLPRTCTILTHCNAGILATCGSGTALSVIYSALAGGKKIHVYADETRPLLQGARLTSWELMQAKVPVTLICDSMGAILMSQNKIDAVIVGADRITLRGDIANKVGTYNLAVLAYHHQVKFYVAAPLSTFDPALDSGAQIPIEMRDPEEITIIQGKRIAPDNVAVFNPAFDVTPARYVTAFITEKGVIYPPYKSAIKKILNQ